MNRNPVKKSRASSGPYSAACMVPAKLSRVLSLKSKEPAHKLVRGKTIDGVATL